MIRHDGTWVTVFEMTDKDRWIVLLIVKSRNDIWQGEKKKDLFFF